MPHPTEQTTNATHNSPHPVAERDAVDSVAHSAPLVLPVVGGVLIFMLAFIAIYMG